MESSHGNEIRPGQHTQAPGADQKQLCLFSFLLDHG
jgi:hypothetical protein